MTTKRKTSLEKVIEISRTILDGGDRQTAIKKVQELTGWSQFDAVNLVATYDDSTSCKALASRWKRAGRVAIACAAESAKQAAGLAAGEKVIAEYLPDAPAVAAKKTPMPEWAERIIAEHIPDAGGKPWGKAIADWMMKDRDNYRKLLEAAGVFDDRPGQGSRGDVQDRVLKPTIQQFVFEEDPEDDATVEEAL